MARQSVMEVYEQVMKRARETVGHSPEDYDVSAELYWVAKLLENTSEINPEK